MATIRALGYFRMSTADQEASIPRQQDWAARACLRENIELVKSFQDAAISGGKIEQRAGLLALLAEAEAAAARDRPYEALVCWNLDRLSRADSIRTAGVLSRLMDAGVCRIFTVEGWADLNNGTDRVLFNLKQDLGRHPFLQSLSENVLEGMARSAREGKFLGSRPPFGYSVGADGRLVPNERADTVRRLFSDYLAGASLGDLARWLTAGPTKAPRGGEWTRSTVRSILTNRAYMGDMVWNATHFGTHSRLSREGVKKDDQSRLRESRQRRLNHKHLDRLANPEEDWIIRNDAHPALVSREDWARCQSCRKGRHQRSSGRGKAGTAWALSGILHCGCCGRVMHACPRKEKDSCGKVIRFYRYYQCAGRRDRGMAACPTSGVAEHDSVLRETVQLLKDHLGGPAAVATIRERLHSKVDAEQGQREAEADALNRHAGELDGMIAQGNRNLAILPADRIPGVVEQVRAWEKERADISARLSALDATTATVGAGNAEDVEEALSLVGSLDALIEEGDAALVRDALAPLVRKVTMHFRPATKADRKGRGNVQFVKSKLVLEPSELLLNLLSQAAPICQVPLTLERVYPPAA